MMEAPKPVVLVIDDTPTSLGAFFELLDSAGFEVLVAEDGVRGIEQATQETPDLILLDVLMPGLDGFETCRRLKEHPRTRDIPVIFMTALDATDSVIKGLQLGAVDYITRPAHREEILARMSVHLQIWRLRRQLEAQNRQMRQEIEERERAEAALENAMKRLESAGAGQPG